MSAPLPRIVAVVDALPRSGAGKVLERELRKKYRDATVTSAEAHRSRPLVRRRRRRTSAPARLCRRRRFNIARRQSLRSAECRVLEGKRLDRNSANMRTDRRISRGDCDQRSSRSATSLPGRERTERRFRARDEQLPHGRTCAYRSFSSAYCGYLTEGFGAAWPFIPLDCTRERSARPSHREASWMAVASAARSTRLAVSVTPASSSRSTEAFPKGPGGSGPRSRYRDR